MLGDRYSFYPPKWTFFGTQSVNESANRRNNLGRTKWSRQMPIFATKTKWLVVPVKKKLVSREFSDLYGGLRARRISMDVKLGHLPVDVGRTWMTLLAIFGGNGVGKLSNF